MGTKPIRFHRDGHPEAGMTPSSFTSPGAFTGDDKREVNHYFHATEDESILAGVWECAPCLEEIESYPANELMTVLAGSLTLTDEEGNKEVYTTGDTFFIPKGAKVTWHITETLRKYYLISA